MRWFVGGMLVSSVCLGLHFCLNPGRLSLTFLLKNFDVYSFLSLNALCINLHLF
jgi:hypothetical protein